MPHLKIVEVAVDGRRNQLHLLLLCGVSRERKRVLVDLVEDVSAALPELDHAAVLRTCVLVGDVEDVLPTRGVPTARAVAPEVKVANGESKRGAPGALTSVGVAHVVVLLAALAHVRNEGGGRGTAPNAPRQTLALAVRADGPVVMHGVHLGGQVAARAAALTVAEAGSDLLDVHQFRAGLVPRGWAQLVDHFFFAGAE